MFRSKYTELEARMLALESQLSKVTATAELEGRYAQTLRQVKALERLVTTPITADTLIRAAFVLSQQARSMAASIEQFQRAIDDANSRIAKDEAAVPSLTNLRGP